MILLVLAGAERRDAEGLRLTAGEQRRTMGARQNADFGDDRADRLRVAAVDARAGVEDVPANDLRLEFDLNTVAICFGRVYFWLFNAFSREANAAFTFAFDGVNGVVALLLVDVIL
jgi:hypothetical protein